jgi:thioredoxin reductase (NADPH)
MLGRCAMPHSFWLADSAKGRALIAQADGEQGFPLVVFPDGRVLADPSNAELADSAGVVVDTARNDIELAIIGAGPAGQMSHGVGSRTGATLIPGPRRCSKGAT